MVHSARNSKKPFKIIIMKSIIGHIGVISLLGLILPYAVFAQSKNIIIVSPQLIQLDLSHDKPEAEFTYTNETSQTIELTLSMQDVKELEDRGIPDILNLNDSKSYKYGLSSWASFSNKTLVIGPHESKKVTVFIDKTRLTLGGHYATVLAELHQLETSKKVKLRAILSSLIFVRSGSQYEQEIANIQSMEVSSKFFQFPTSVSFRLQNTGNVDLTPYGILTVTDSWGREVAREVVNENSLITLPDSVRKYTIPLFSPQGVIPPGTYKAQLVIHFGKKKVSRERNLSFFILGKSNLLSIGAALLSGAVIVMVLRHRKKRLQ